MAELRFGAALRGWGSARLLKLEARIAAAEIVHSGPELIETYARVRVECWRAGHALAQKGHNADRWVAATAIRLQVPLVSNDGIFVNTPGLTLESVHADQRHQSARACSSAKHDGDYAGLTQRRELESVVNRVCFGRSRRSLTTRPIGSVLDHFVQSTPLYPKLFADADDGEAGRTVALQRCSQRIVAVERIGVCRGSPSPR